MITGEYRVPEGTDATGHFKPKTDYSFPDRVVAVVSAPARGGYAYITAAVYELRPRKEDGALTYRRTFGHAQPRRSKQLAEQDARELAGKLAIPFWPAVRHHMTAVEAWATHHADRAPGQTARTER